MQVFMCYSRKDEAFVARLAADLRAKGIAVWRDVDNIPADVASNTSGWRAAVDKALRECTHLIIVLSPDSAASPEVGSEWNYALGQGRPVIPVLHRDCEIPYRLYALNYWDMRTEYAPVVDRLAKALAAGRLDSAATTRQAAGKTLPPGSRRRLPWLPVAGIAAALLVIGVVIVGLVVQGWGEPPDGGGAPGGADGGQSPDDLTPLVAQAVLDFDAQMRRALETGDITGLSAVARGDALQGRLDAVEILRAAGNCHWVYDQRGLEVQRVVFADDRSAAVEATVDRDGRVFCDDGERPEYAFEGPYYATYTVEWLDGRWLVTQYKPVTQE